MRSLNDTITRLGAMRSRAARGADVAVPDRLTDLHDFGSNPGALRARGYVPETLAAGAALVVVLHGCTQTAAGYDLGSGWSRLAEEQGFALLFPEQRRANNPNLCFNWYNPEDARRGSGEALSIRQMVAAMIARHDIDPKRVFVTGLSAGGAMTSAMLATYPDVFAGGAIIAGLPYGTARNVPEAFDRMRAHGGPEADALGDLVATAADHRGPWPRVSVWHGHSDATVHAANAAMIVDQWRGLHGVGSQPSREETIAGYPRRIWSDAAGRDVIEEYEITGMGHGTPISASGADSCGVAGPYMLEARISSTRHIARFWGVTGDEPVATSKTPAPATRVNALRVVETPGDAGQRAKTRRFPPAPGGEQSAVGRVIEDALRAAGLMR